MTGSSGLSPSSSRVVKLSVVVFFALLILGWHYVS